MILNLILLAIVGFVQNMAFTFSSRSRNSGNPSYHFIAASFSNGIWFICNFYLIFPEMLKIIETGNNMMKLVVMLVYVFSTTAGSVFMMSIMLGKIRVPLLSKFLLEKENKKVGSR